MKVLAGNALLKGNIVRLLSAAFYLKHHISKEALKDHLLILNISSEKVIDEQLTSPYLFLKRFTNFKKTLSEFIRVQFAKILLKRMKMAPPQKFSLVDINIRQINQMGATR